MAYYFSYDALIPNYIEEDGFYTKEELHCTLAYSKNDIPLEKLENLNSDIIPGEEKAVITKIDVFNRHIVLLIENINLNNINEKIVNDFSITEDHKERKMHVSIKKGLENDQIDLRAFENKYIGKEITLYNPKLILKNVITKEETVIELNSLPPKNKLKPKI